MVGTTAVGSLDGLAGVVDALVGALDALDGGKVGALVGALG